MGRTPLHTAGWTPVYNLARLGEPLGIKQLWLKDESRNPTASFKDRASALVVARAMETHAEVVITASTGNAGAALAGMAAAVGQKAVVLAPKSAPPAKIAQILIFGATVALVDGTYDDAFDLTIKAANEFGWYCRNTGYNPFTAEGKKTAALEIWEWWQHAHEEWHHRIGNGVEHAPLTVFVSVGDGNIISGIHKGFKDLRDLGWMPQIPRLIGVQAEGSAAIANAFRAGSEEIVPVAAKTIADSISVDLPRDGVRARACSPRDRRDLCRGVRRRDPEGDCRPGNCRCLRRAGGRRQPMRASPGPAGGIVRSEDPVLVLNTGSGLKDVKAAMLAAGEAPVIKPTLSAPEDALASSVMKPTLLHRCAHL